MMFKFLKRFLLPTLLVLVLVSTALAVGTWECSEDEDDSIYSFGDMLAEVTDGTTGTPARASDYVTADRAGTAVLLEAETCTTNHTLSEQIRPVEDLAIQITFTVAGSSAGAGDTLVVTGTDWRGAAQGPESITCEADGAYTGSNYWRTITDIDCTGWADGTLKVEQDRWGLIWDLGNGQYQNDADFDIGDASTTTFFDIKDGESFVSPVGLMRTRANATLRVGESEASFSGKSSYLKAAVNYGTRYFVDGGDFYLYGSLFELLTDAFGARNGNIYWYDSIIKGHAITATGGFVIEATCAYTLRNMYINKIRFFFVQGSPTLAEDFHIHTCERGFYAYGGAMTCNLVRPRVTNYTTADYATGGAAGETDLNAISPIGGVLSPVNQNAATDEVRQQHYINIHIADKDGANLSGATVVLDGSVTINYDTERFSVATAADGTIAQQTITAIQWAGTDETETNYNLHRLTVSLADYKNLVLENITIGNDVDWHLELQPIGYPPSPWFGMLALPIIIGAVVTYRNRRFFS